MRTAERPVVEIHSSGWFSLRVAAVAAGFTVVWVVKLGSSSGTLMLSAAVLAAMLLLALHSWRLVGGDSVRADDTGLSVLSHRQGDRQLAWADVLELGWVPARRGGYMGLAARLRPEADDGRPEHVVRWLCTPLRLVRPDQMLDELRALADSHGVTWRDYPAGYLR